MLHDGFFSRILTVSQSMIISFAHDVTGPKSLTSARLNEVDGFQEQTPRNNFLTTVISLVSKSPVGSMPNSTNEHDGDDTHPGTDSSWLIP